MGCRTACKATWLAGQYDNPMTDQGFMNSATGKDPNLRYVSKCKKCPNLKQRSQSRYSSLIPHCKCNSVYIFLFWKLLGLSRNFYIHVSVSDLYIPRIGPHISYSRNGSSIVGIHNSLTDT
jgi:hypothetical protein